MHADQPGPGTTPASAQPPAGVALPATDTERIDELVEANRILHDHRVLDGFGHVSVRSAADPRHFFMARSGLVPEWVQRSDVIEYDEDSAPFAAGGQTGPSERFIHGEIYRARPDVYAVAHSHTQSVLPFALTAAPLQAVIHTAYFLGDRPAPVFEIREPLGERNGMLVDNAIAGQGLARALGERSVVLMRGHGMTVAAPSIRDVTYRAVYTRVNAEIEAEAFRLGQPEFLNEFEVDRDEPVSMQWNWWAARSATRRAGR